MKSLLLSFRWAAGGLAHVIVTQRNMRIHLAFAVGVALLGLLLGLSFVEWAVLSLTIAFVLCAEAFNTSVEEIVNQLSPQQHPAAKQAKDAAAGAVLLAAISSVIVGLFLFGPRLWRLVFESI